MTFRHEVKANVSARAAQPKRPKPVPAVVDWDAAIERWKVYWAARETEDTENRDT